MKSDIVIHRLNKVIDKHSEDTGFSYHMQPIAEYFDDLEVSLNILNNFAYNKKKNYKDITNLSVEDLLKIHENERKINQTIDKLLKDKDVEKNVKKYRTLIEKVLETKKILTEKIKENNSITKPLEIVIAEKLLNKLKFTEESEKNSFEYLEKIALTGKNHFTNEHIEGDDYTLLYDLETARNLNDTIQSLPTNDEIEEELSYIKWQAKQVYESISDSVVKHYDSLIEIDNRLNKDQPLIRVREEEYKTTEDKEIEVN